MKKIENKLRQIEDGYMKHMAKVVSEFLDNVPDESGVDFCDGLSEQIEQELEGRKDIIKNVLLNSKKMLNMFLDRQLKEIESSEKEIQSIRELEMAHRLEMLNND